MVARKLANDLAHGADESIFVGSGLEYAQSRPYEAGDSIQSMDWKISARTGTPFVKEYDTLKRVPVQIVVDTSGSMVASSGSLSKYAMSTWIAAAIGLVAQRRMSPTRLIGGGARKLPSQTSLSRGALQQAMEALRHPDAGEKTHIADALDWVRATTLQRSVVFVLSDLHDPEVIDACRRLSQGHDVAVIEFQDPVESGLTHGGYYRGSEAETGQTFLGSSKTGWGIDSNKGRRGELAEGGIDHLLLKCDQDFISPVRRFLSDRGRG